jgi:quinol monooxygenase YgiN
MFCINVVLTVKDAADVEKVAEYLRRAGRLSRDEPGCAGFEVCHSQGDPRVFLLCERWASEQAWRDHREREAFTTIYQPHVLPLVDRTPHICTLLD